MSPEPVLERNVRLLLCRSYVPALPAPHFRDRLESLFLAEVARRARARGAARRFRAAPVLLALAAGLAAVFLGWRLLAPGAAPTRAGLLARGEVALGFPDGSWRAADAEERVHGLAFVPPSLVAATPAAVELDLLLAAGRVHLGQRSEILLERGAQGDSATLRAGSATFHVHEQRLELAPGVTRVLAPAPPQPVALASADRPAERESLDAGAPAAPPLESAPARVLAGRVVVAETGAPVSAFTVALLAERTGNETPPPVRREFAATDGAFRWEDPPPGKQRVFVHAEGHALAALGEHDLSGVLPELSAELEPGHRVRGSVLDADGNPIAGALVISETEAPTDGLLFADPEPLFWLPIQARSGPDGRFELEHVGAGVHTIRASAPEHSPAWEDGVRVPAERELVLVLGTGGAVEGTVTGADGGPRSGAEVVVVALDQIERRRTSFGYARTDASGRYRFEHLPVTTMIVVRMRADERPDVRPVKIVDGETVTADFAEPRHGLRLFGKLAGRDGRPLVQRNLGLFDLETASWSQDWIGSTTDDEGGYAFLGVEPGRYQIFLIDNMGRGLLCLDELAIAPGEVEREHDLRLSGGRLDVTARDARSGAPVQSALFLMRVEPDGRHTFFAFGSSDAAGDVRFDDLREGRYLVVSYPMVAGLGFAHSEVVEVGESGARLEVLHEEGGSVDVVVRDPDGRGLEGATVLFLDESDGEHVFSRLPMTDASGRYRAHGLRPGRYRVIARIEGYQGTPVEFRFELGRELEIPVLLAPIPPR